MVLPLTMPIKNKWLAVSTLAIVLPISLLAAFKFTGILNEPQQPETITQDPVVWSMERPSHIMPINKTIEKSYSDDYLSATFNVYIDTYRENSPVFFFDYRDGITLHVCFNATVTYGSLISVTNHVRPTETNSTVVTYIGDSEWPEKYNIDVANKRYYGVKDEEAYAEAKVTGSPCCWIMLISWIFNDENTLNHQLNITNEFLYWNTSKYKREKTTFILKVVVDAGNDFDSPNVRQISYGSYFGSIYHANDPVDFYKIWLEKREPIIVTVSPSPFFDISLYLYNSNKTLITSSCHRGFIPEQIEFTANKTGYWFIKIAYSNGSSGTYTLNIKQKNQVGPSP